MTPVAPSELRSSACAMPLPDSGANPRDGFCCVTRKIDARAVARPAAGWTFQTSDRIASVGKPLNKEPQPSQ